jgi:hypothetical protein
VGEPVDRRAVVDALVRVLTPHLGEHMARAAVGSQLERQDKSAVPDPTCQNLVDALGMGLNVFVGRENSQRCVSEMLRAIEEINRRRP